MKTTVKLTRETAVFIEPATAGRVRLAFIERSEMTGAWGITEGATLTADQAAALLFGIEQAAEASERATA